MQRSRAVIIENGQIALIHRVKPFEGNTLSYYVFPGGGVETGETPEQAAAREVLEELGLQVEITHLIAEVNLSHPERFYRARVLGGVFGTGSGPEFARSGAGTYTPVWVPLQDLPGLPVWPEPFKVMLLEQLQLQS